MIIRWTVLAQQMPKQNRSRGIGWILRGNQQRGAVSFSTSEPLINRCGRSDWYLRAWIALHLFQVGVRLAREHESPLQRA